MFYSFSDNETKKAMEHLNSISNYVADPHGAVGYLGLKKFVNDKSVQGIFLETAHPVKFLDVVEPVINKVVEIPAQIKEVIDKEKEAIFIRNYDEFKNALLVE